jgi:hypothetical protein
MYLLLHSSTGTFSGVVDELYEHLWCMQQPRNGIHTTARVAFGQEVVKDQGNFVVLDHLWSLDELFRWSESPPLRGAEATKLFA